MKNEIEIPKELKIIGHKVLNNEKLDELETLILLFVSYSYCYSILKNFNRGKKKCIKLN